MDQVVSMRFSVAELEQIELLRKEMKEKVLGFQLSKHGFLRKLIFRGVETLSDVQDRRTNL